MGVLNFWSTASSKAAPSEPTGDKKQDRPVAKEEPKPSEDVLQAAGSASEPAPAEAGNVALVASATARDIPLPPSPPPPVSDSVQEPASPEPPAQPSLAPSASEALVPPASDAAPSPVSSSVPTPELVQDVQPSVKPSPPDNRRFSFRALGIFGGRVDHRQQLSAIEERHKKDKAAEAYTKHTVKQTSSDRRAKESALVVRSLIVGPSSITPSSAMVKAVSKPQIKKVKAQLLEPKSANRVIAQLRQLPLTEGPLANGPAKPDIRTKNHGPIHAVCLPYTDTEAQERHFSRLAKDLTPEPDVPSVTNANFETVTSTFKDLQVVDLLTRGGVDMGLASPIGSPTEGILSGALPSAEAMINGITQITPQLMNLGFATGKAIMPDHTGVYPPTDRMSVITYWWGLEVVLPEPSMHYLSNVPSISHSVLNFLSALALVNNGVAEILPFVRYISSYIDFEWNSIQKQDHGQGVVCAATWIMPAAMVPRPWDFESPPADEAPVAEETPERKSGSMLKPEVPSTPAKGDGSAAPEPGTGTPPSKSEEPTEMPTLPPPLPSFKVIPPTLSKKTGDATAPIVTPPEKLAEEPAVQIMSLTA